MARRLRGYGPMSAQSIKILVSALVIAGAAGFLFYDQLVSNADALTYFYPVDEVIEEQASLQGQRIRMGGHVVKGSIFQKKGTIEYQFDVKPHPAMIKFPERKDETITVHYTGVVPDTFKDDAEVIVVGQVGANGAFTAQELIAKCPSKYEAAEKNKGEY